MPGQGYRDTREKPRIAELPPELGIRREMRTQFDKLPFLISIRGHPVESSPSKPERSNCCQKQLNERFPASQAMNNPVAPGRPVHGAQERQSIKFPLQRGKGKSGSAGEFTHMSARIGSGSKRLKQVAKGETR